MPARSSQTPLNDAAPTTPGVAPARAHQRNPTPGETTNPNQNQNQPKRRMRANINIATLNMNGLTAPRHHMSYTEKWALVNQTLNEHKIAILALQETHLDQETADLLRTRYQNKMEILTSADPNTPRASAGVAFIINKNLIAPRGIRAHELHAGRALAIEVDWLETEKTTLFNIYAPNEKITHTAFWKDIDTKRRAKQIPHPNFMLGDFNVTEDPIDRAPARLDCIAATAALRDTRHDWGVQDAWRLEHPNERTYTYQANANGNQIMSRLDRIYVANQLIPLTRGWKIEPAPVPTDHWLVSVKYAPKEAPMIGKGRWTMPLQILENEKFIGAVIILGIKLQQDLESLQRNNVDRDDSNPQRLWKIFKSDIGTTARKMRDVSQYKRETHMRRLRDDLKTTMNNPDIDTNDNLRWNGNLLSNEIKHLENIRARKQRDNLSATLAQHGEKPGGIWSAISKEKKPRDLIRCLKIPGSNPPQYERDSQRMAELARKYHDTLQDVGRGTIDTDELVMRTDLVLEEIPRSQKLSEPERSTPDWNLSEDQVRKALHLSKNGSATGIDGCPYELWKALQTQYDKTTQEAGAGFNITQTITTLLTDIQTHGVDEESDFALGWMCPIYKKKDRSDISNYRPITLLNTDYKLLTKTLALQLMNHIKNLIHPDQAGFIPGRSIFDHIKLAEAIICYAEIAEENGAIVALDQEKAYDKIDHDYLWDTLRSFNLPEPFIKTIRELYLSASTTIAVNGILSKPFKVRRGIRQGDPLSCPLFDLAIEPLACMIRNDVGLKGIEIPGLDHPIKANFFADDTCLYLSKDDSLDYAQTILSDWCQVSGAKFNTEKTEIIPIGSADHRQRVITTRRINPTDTPLDARIKIANDGDAIRSLGAWIGNHVNNATPWEPILDKIKQYLDRWKRTFPTMRGRKIIIQIVIGGLTQFLAKAQGMPAHIEFAITKIIRSFMWENDSSPRIALEILQQPTEVGGLGLLDIQARNDAIDLMWLKSYLNFSPTRPDWAVVTDMIIDAAAPPAISQKARANSFLQTWNAPTRGQRAAIMTSSIISMSKAAKKHNVTFAAIRLSPNLSAQLPAWYHISTNNRPLTNVASRCLLHRHKVVRVADLVAMSARIRNDRPDAPHNQDDCACADCTSDRLEGCRNPHACAQEALTRIHQIKPKLNPLQPRGHHGNLSLTKRRKAWNVAAKQNQGAILFDPSFTSKNNLGECFRVFTDPNGISDIPAERLEPYGRNLRLREVTIYTDGACLKNGKADARCGSGIWFGPNHHKNRAIRIPGNLQSNQVGEVAAIIAAIEAVPGCCPLKIVSDSKYAIEGLTTHLRAWEDRGWIKIKNATLFKRAAYLLKRRSAPTSFQWVKGHNGSLGNEESDRLAKEGAAKDTPDILEMDIPKEFDLQGAKLASLNQATIYRGIMERKTPPIRHTTDRNLEKTRTAIERHMGNVETNETIWHSLRSTALSPKLQQFMYKSMNSTQKVGSFWDNIPDNEDRSLCKTCHETESMEHILTQCPEPTKDIVWKAAKDLWPHAVPWPEIDFGLILGCGIIATPKPPQQNVEGRQRTLPNKGPTRLLRILISEATHLIWVIRCERVIQGRPHPEGEIDQRWTRAINKRLTDDKIIATKSPKGKKYDRKVRATWEEVLRSQGALPNDWTHHSEYLVGSRHGGARPVEGP